MSDEVIRLLTDEERKAVESARTMTPLTLLMVVDTIKAEARREAEVLAERKSAIAVAREHLRMVTPHECVTGPLCDGWPFAVDDAYRTIAAVAWPGERKENRDGWAVTMRHRPDLFEQEARRARERLDAAIAHGRAALRLTEEPA